MQKPLDYKDLLRILNRHRVQYLIVGAYAVIYYSEPRYTKDLDIWLKPEAENAKRAYEALREFGAPLKGIGPGDFANKDIVYQIGIAPVRVDVMMGIPGMEFDKVWRHRSITSFDGIKANIIGINELIKSKKTAGRQMDIADIESLKCGLKLRKKK